MSSKTKETTQILSKLSESLSLIRMNDPLASINRSGDVKKKTGIKTGFSTSWVGGMSLLSSPCNGSSVVFRVNPLDWILDMLLMCPLAVAPEKKENCWTVVCSIPLNKPASHLASSSDGRLLAVANADGSISCFDVTASRETMERFSITLRWTTRINNGAPSSIRSLAFAPLDNSEYWLMVVDSENAQLTIYNAAARDISIATIVSTNASSASWYSCNNLSEPSQRLIAIAGSDGSLGIAHFDGEKLDLIRTLNMPARFRSAENNGVPWRFSHLNWLQTTQHQHEQTHTLAVGFTRILELSKEEEESNQNDDDDDPRQHQVAFFIGSFSNISSKDAAVKWDEMSDVAPFFSVPKGGKHALFSTYASLALEISDDPKSTADYTSSCRGLLFVGCNLSSDVSVIAHFHMKNESSPLWELLDMQEGSNATAPVDESDNFTFPVGLVLCTSPIVSGSSIPTEKQYGTQVLLLASNNGALSQFTINLQTDEEHDGHAYADKSSSIITIPPLHYTSIPQIEQKQHHVCSSPLHVGTGTIHLNNILSEDKTSSFTVGSTSSSSSLVAEGILEEEEAPSGAVAKAAFKFFEELDSGNTGRLPSDCFESLLELLGEGFCGEELQTQLNQVDPERCGIITKPKFIDWYVKLVEGSSAKEDHSDQSFTDDVERAEELEKAIKAFDRISSSCPSDLIPSSNFKDLMEALGTVYCEEEHRHTIKKISVEGMISRSNFTTWYLDWLFGEGESSNEEEAEKGGASSTKDKVSTRSWGGLFAVAEGSWKCPSCMLRNTAGATCCPACETAKPGTEREKSKTAGSSEMANSSIGPLGFTFGSSDTSRLGSATKSKAIGTSNSAATPNIDKKELFANSSSYLVKPSMSIEGTIEHASESSTFCVPSSFGSPRGLSAKSAASPTGNIVPCDKKTNNDAISSSFANSKGSIGADDSGCASDIGLNAVKVTTSTSSMFNYDSSAAAKAVSKIFDELDVGKSGQLNVDRFESVLELLGEGFHGDELQSQLDQVDPKKCGMITKTNLIAWYARLTDGASSNADKNDDESERAEELEKANNAFDRISGADSAELISADKFKDLMEALGTVYCDDEHRHTMKKISIDGRISRSKFTTWYISWLFEEGLGSDEETEEESLIKLSSDNKQGAGGWGNLFAVSKGSWKCPSCMLINMSNLACCPACETARPCAENETDASCLKAEPTAAGSICSSGFLFGPAALSSNESVGKFNSNAQALTISKSPALNVDKENADATSSSAESALGNAVAVGFVFGSGRGAPSFGSTSGAFQMGVSGAEKNSNELGAILSEDSTLFKTSATEASFPPITPFCGRDSIKTGVGTSSSTTSSEAPPAFSEIRSISEASFPPMSTTPPAPFIEGRITPNVEIKTPISGFAPTSMKTPTTFAVSKSVSGASFPPMSSKAPTTFSEKKEVSGASVPPLPTKPPISFTGSNSVAKVENNKLISGPTFPPMSVKAPPPFSGCKSAAGASFPPMSLKAPTTFSEKKEVSRASVPPMPPYPPTSFTDSNSVGKVENSKSVSGPTFPPASANAPTLFARSKSAAGASFPPMSTKAPTLFNESSGASKLEKKSFLGSSKTSHFFSDESSTPIPDNIKSLAAPSFPLNSSMAPSLTAASSTLDNETTTLVNPLYSESLGAPSTHSASGVISNSSKVGKSTLSSPKPSNKLPVSAMSSTSEDSARSKYEDLVWKLVHKFQSSLSLFADTGEIIPKLLISDNERRASILRDRHQLELVLLSGSTPLLLLKQRAVLLLSRKDVWGRKITEATSLLREAKPGSVSLNFANQQPLDSESEFRRRSLRAMALQVQGMLASVTECLELMLSMFYLPSENSIKIANNGPTQTQKTKRLLLFLKAAYDRTTSVDTTVERLLKEVDAISPFEDFRRTHRNQIPPVQNKRSACSIRSFDEVSRGVAALQRSIHTIADANHRIPTTRQFRQEVPNVKLVRDAQRIIGHESERSQVASTLTNSSHTIQSRVQISNYLISDTGSKASLVALPRRNVETVALSMKLPDTSKELLSFDIATSALAELGTSFLKVSEAHEKKKKGFTPIPIEKGPLSKAEQSSLAPSRSIARSDDRSAIPEACPSKPHLLSGEGTTATKIYEPKQSGDDYDNICNDDKLSSVGMFVGFEEALSSECGTTNAGKETKEDETITASEISLRQDAVDPNSDDAPLFSAVEDPSTQTNYYRHLLTGFYQEHNLAKIGDIENNLAKYKGREAEMFAKLSAKYNAPNPLSKTHDNFVFGSSTFDPTMSLEKTPFHPSAFSNTLQTVQTTKTTNTPFGVAASSPSAAFGGIAAASSQSGISPSISINQGAIKKSSLAFGASNPFGMSVSMPMPIMQSIPCSTVTFGGKTAREILVDFYQQHNPSKITEVDKLLAKYAGNEENLLRNLSRKYNIDERLFGLPSLPAASDFSSSPAPTPFGVSTAFGSGFGAGSSHLGGGPAPSSFGTSRTVAFGAGLSQLAYNAPNSLRGAFGQPPQASASSTSFSGSLGSSTFGSSPSVSFGALASGQGGSGFGFTSPPAPFGSARR